MSVTERFAQGLTDYLSLEALEPWPGNYREHDVGAIAQSLERFGQQRPVLVQTRNGERPRIVAGHGIVEGARALGWLRVAVTLTDLDELDARAYLVTDNRTHQLGRDRLDDLAALLTDVADQRSGLTATGYDHEDLEQILVQVERDRQEGPAERERCPTCGRYL